MIRFDNVTKIYRTDGHRRIILSNRLGPIGLAPLLRSPVLSTVRELALPYNDLGDEGVAALAACPHAANLRRLDAIA